MKLGIDCIDKYLENLPKAKKTSFFGKKNNDFFDGEEEIFETAESCVICNRLNKIENDFILNILYLYDKDDDFKKKFNASKGFCIKHFKELIEAAHQYYNFEKSREFLINLAKIEKSNLSVINEDINWFTKKFDYRYKDEEWKNSKDAVQRACAKTSSTLEE